MQILKGKLVKGECIGPELKKSVHSGGQIYQQTGLITFDRAISDVLYKQSVISISGAWLTGAVAVFLLYKEAPLSFLIIWFTLYSAVMILRLMICILYNKETHEILNPEKWIKGFTWLSGVSGTCWGYLEFSLFPVVPLMSKVTLVLFAAGLSASAIASYAAVFKTSLAYFLPFLGSIVLVALLHPSEPYQSIGVLTLLYMVVLSMTARQMNISVVNAISLQFKNARLVESLKVSQAEYKNLNLKLYDEIQCRKKIQLNLEKTLKDLQVTKKRAEQANDAKTRFVAVISHEIRTPLNGISLAIQRLRKINLPEKARQYIDILASSGDSLFAIVADTLDLTQINAGRLKIEYLEFNLFNLLKNISEQFKEGCREKGLELSYEFDPQVPQVVISAPLQLRQIVNNLIGNAIKFTDNGKIELIVRNYEGDDYPGGIMITVSDTGPGIRVDYTHSIFDPFVQAEASKIRRRGEGIGLGLSICKKYIEKMNGKIWVESEFGKGSAFHFIICHPMVNRFPSDQLRMEKIISPLVSLSILLAEDDEVSRILMAELLESGKHEVHSVRNGREAVDAVRAGQYDLILMDLEMPEMDGIEATLTIRGNERTDVKRLPIIIITAQAFSNDRQKCLDAGADGYISKPFTAEGLFLAIAKAVPRAQTESESVLSAVSRMMAKEVIRKRTKGNVNVLKKMVRVFIRTYPDACSEIDSAITCRDGERLWRAAHKLKGSVSFFDEEIIDKWLQALEMAGKNNDYGSGGKIWTDLRRDLNDFVSDLEDL